VVRLRAGIRFAFIRYPTARRCATDVATTGQASAPAWCAAAYQFFRPDQNVIAQADAMTAAWPTAIRDDLPPVLDGRGRCRAPAAGTPSAARAWIDRVRGPARRRADPLHRQRSVAQRAGAAPLGNQPLWIAHYTQDCPTLPQPWTRWTFWQHTDSRRYPHRRPGRSRSVRGSLGELHATR